MIRGILYFCLALLTALSLALIVKAFTYTPAFRDEAGNVVPNSIAGQRRVMLGGWGQYVLVRGRDKSKPLLLFVHGGPGTPEMPLVRVYNADLENDFVVVNWDQRGTGKSYSSDIDPKTITLPQIVADMDELIDKLRDEFGKDKVLLVCHSWGTQVCLEYLSKHPEKAAGYVAIGQVVNQQRSDLEGYHWALSQAKDRGDEAALRDLREIGPPPYAPDTIGRQRAYINKFGGSFYKPQSLLRTLATALRAPETSWLDYFSFRSGTALSNKMLWSALQGLDAIRDYPEIKVPIFFVHGRHDRQVSAIQAEDYFGKVVAPRKEMIWFENSAHSPPFEEPARFNAEIKRISAALTLK